MGDMNDGFGIEMIADDSEDFSVFFPETFYISQLTIASSQETWIHYYFFEPSPKMFFYYPQKSFCCSPSRERNAIRPGSGLGTV